jgi:hypothetical protein
MFRFLSLVLGLVLLTTTQGWSQNPSPSGDQFIGDFEGVYRSTGRPDYASTAKVIAEGRGLYRLLLQYTPPATESWTYQVELHGQSGGPRLFFNGFSNADRWEGIVQDGKLTINKAGTHYGGGFSLAKVIKHSPTEGLKPPRGAKILLPFEEGKKSSLAAWTNNKWTLGNDGTMQVKKGDQRTKERFGSIQIHLEFNLAHMPNSHGQGRSNSGIYFQDRYEVQILDSFGLIPSSGDCGSIYEQSVALVNMSYPPGQWQTYDAVFTAAEFDKNGKVKTYPTVTVEHNGVLIQDKHEYKKVTGGAVNDKVVERAPIRLQDHGNPVKYRNIWIKELN